MYRSRQKHSARIRGFAIATILIAAIGATIGSCVFDTKTNFCEQFGLRCKEGQECAANQPVCINVGGCGNHHLDPGEACDDGNIMDGDGCSADCLSDETCGNGITDRNAEIPEECDDGKLNGVGNDICDSNCHLRSFVCGNKIVDQDQGEQCDPGPTDSQTCNSDLANMNGLMAGCKLSRCGDGYTNMVAKEQCDTAGIDTIDCNGLLCRLSVCGDNYHNAAAGEACDNGSADTVGCNGNNNGSDNPENCQFPSCGDGYVNTKFIPSGALLPEQCDNIGGGDTDKCNGNNKDSNGPGSCRVPLCGDGYTNVAAGEHCDNLGGGDTDTCNGNNKGSNGPGSCQLSACGDGYTNTKAGEQCDVLGGSDSARNGATPGCNGKTAGSASCHFSICGDGYTNMPDGEACDSGSDDTAICNGSKALPTNVACQLSICGDMHVNTVAGEACDKGSADTKTCNGNNAGSASCQFPQCGDGHINTAAGEDCESNSDCTAPKTCKSCNCS